MKLTKRYYRVDRRQISFLRFIFEAYDGIATIETLDAQKGILAFAIGTGCEDDVHFVLEDLKTQMMIEPLE